MKILAKEAQTLIGLRLTQAQLAELAVYAQELAEWNARYNLTAIKKPEEVRIKHFLDSLTVLLAMRGTATNRVIDVGTGAGFPGLPLKIVFPEIRLALVESVGKKADFCRHIVERLGLQEVEVLQARAEEVGRWPSHREQYDWAIARAVARMPVLMEYLLPLVRVGGHALAQKSESAHQEVQDSANAMRVLGGHLQKLHRVTLPGVVEERYLVVVDKRAATPSKYPRRTGIPAKRPL